jgi:hypothetical protein
MSNHSLSANGEMTLAVGDVVSIPLSTPLCAGYLPRALILEGDEQSVSVEFAVQDATEDVCGQGVATAHVTCMAPGRVAMLVEMHRPWLDGTALSYVVNCPTHKGWGLP